MYVHSLEYPCISFPSIFVDGYNNHPAPVKYSWTLIKIYEKWIILVDTVALVVSEIYGFHVD